MPTRLLPSTAGAPRASRSMLLRHLMASMHSGIISSTIPFTSRSPARAQNPLMPVSRLSVFVLLSGLLFAGPALAANLQDHSCLNKAEQRLVVASHKAIPLAGIMKSRRAQGHYGE